MSLHKHHGADRVVKGELPRAHAAMNITPMIDVLLVLLVIFMVTLPLNQRGVDITVPLRRHHRRSQSDASYRPRIHE
jgi:biopolymer transport protein ExbD